MEIDLNNESIKSIIISIITGKVEPVDNSNQSEYFDKIKKIQKCYKENPKRFKELINLQNKLKKDTISDAEIDDLFDNSKSTADQRVAAEYVVNIYKNPSSVLNFKWRKVH